MSPESTWNCPQQAFVFSYYIARHDYINILLFLTLSQMFAEVFYIGKTF